MKLRHFAALALVGWYLMVPPLAADRTNDASASLSRWTISDSFDSAAECRETLLRRWSRAQDQKDSSAEDEYRKAACVSTDDPRLKGKGDAKN